MIVAGPRICEVCGEIVYCLLTEQHPRCQEHKSEKDVEK